MSYHLLTEDFDASRSSGRRALMLAVVALAAVIMASPGSAQSTGHGQGEGRRRQGPAGRGRRVTIEYKDGISRKYEVKTNKKGEFIQIGLPPGQYKVTAEKDKLVAVIRRARAARGYDRGELQAGARRGGRCRRRRPPRRAPDQEAVRRGRRGQQGRRLRRRDREVHRGARRCCPDCFDCYYNIGYAYTQKKEYDKAEESFKKAIELKADYVEAYNGLATVYNAQKKFDEAQARPAEGRRAGCGGGRGARAARRAANVDALYNQGVIAWNAGKAEDAQKKLRGGAQAQPEPRRFALPARHDAGQPGQAAGGGRWSSRPTSSSRPRASTRRRPRRSSPS